MTAGHLTINEKIAVTNYLLNNTDISKLKRIMEEISRNEPPISITPPIWFIIQEVCLYCNITEEQFKSTSAKKEFVHARMLCVNIFADFYISPGRNNKLYIRKKYMDQLFMKPESVKYLIRKGKNLVTIYEKLGSEMTYLALRISWKYLKMLETDEEG